MKTTNALLVAALLVTGFAVLQKPGVAPVAHSVATVPPAVADPLRVARDAATPIPAVMPVTEDIASDIDTTGLLQEFDAAELEDATAAAGDSLLHGE